METELNPLVFNQRITLKKGIEVETSWMIYQERPYPTIGTCLGSIQWENNEGIFPNYGRDAEGLPERYCAHLIPCGSQPPENWDRTHLAGYEGRPGGFTYRGNEFGEMSLRYGFNEFDQSFKIRGFDNPTPGERDFIRSQIIPGIIAFTKENQAKIFRIAVASVKKRMHQKCDEAVREIEKLRREIGEAKF